MWMRNVGDMQDGKESDEWLRWGKYLCLIKNTLWIKQKEARCQLYLLRHSCYPDTEHSWVWGKKAGSHASQAPPSTSCLFIRLLIPLLPQYQRTLTDCVTQGDVEITHSRLLSSERSLMRLCTQRLLFIVQLLRIAHRWVSISELIKYASSIHSEPEKSGGQFLMAYWPQHR